MHWPSTPVEQLTSFQPPFCPRASCRDHRPNGSYDRYKRDGYYSTQRRARVQRFECQTCGQGFSTQTFSVTYYRKRPHLLRPIAAGIVAGSALRQIARSLDCSPSTVAGIASRLGRHAMLLHARVLQELRGKLNEAVVLDHFESFEYTQDYPFGVATAVGALSWFVFALDPAPHGRGGKRSTVQARKLRSRPKRALRGRYAGSTDRVLETLRKLVPEHDRLELISDGHPDYRKSVAKLRCAVGHRIHPNPPRGPKGSPRSAAARARDRAMFPVDLLHKIVRHTLAQERRETIAINRRLNAAMERLALTAIWRNFVKRRSERKGRSPTPAQWLGLTDRRWSWKQVFSRRLFYGRSSLPEPWPTLYRRQWTTPLLHGNAVHDLKLNF
jgi:transposase-like protein